MGTRRRDIRVTRTGRFVRGRRPDRNPLRRRHPPLQDSQVTGQAYFAEGFTVFTLAVLLTITGLLARRTLDRRRMAAWDTEWRATGPHWTTRA